jgi:hypothetical protein
VAGADFGIRGKYERRSAALRRTVNMQIGLLRKTVCILQTTAPQGLASLGRLISSVCCRRPPEQCRNSTAFRPKSARPWRTPHESRRVVVPARSMKAMRFAGPAGAGGLCQVSPQTGSHVRSDWPTIRAPARRMAAERQEATASTPQPQEGPVRPVLWPSAKLRPNRRAAVPSPQPARPRI